MTAEDDMILGKTMTEISKAFKITDEGEMD